MSVYDAIEVSWPDGAPDRDVLAFRKLVDDWNADREQAPVKIVGPSKGVATFRVRLRRGPAHPRLRLHIDAQIGVYDVLAAPQDDEVTWRIRYILDEADSALRVATKEARP